MSLFNEQLELQCSEKSKQYEEEDKVIGLEWRVSAFSFIKVMFYIVMFVMFSTVVGLFMSPVLTRQQFVVTQLPFVLLFATSLPPFNWIRKKIIYKNFSILKSLKGEYNREQRRDET